MDTDGYNAIQSQCAVSESGSSSGNGTIEQPIDLATLETLAATMWPGATIEFSGTYSGLQTIGLSGNPDGEIVLGGLRLDGRLILTQDYVDMVQSEIFDSTINRTTASISLACIKPDSDDLRIINCYLHDQSMGVLGGGKRLNVYGNVIQYCGTDSNKGHSLYLSNSYKPSPLVVENNVSSHPLGYGIHCYSESATYIESLENIQVINNTSFMAGSIRSTPQGNILIGGSSLTRPHNCVARGNLTYWPDEREGSRGLLIGFGAWGSDDCIVENNILIGGQYAFRAVNPRNLAFRNNVIYGAVNGIDPAAYPDNEYHAFSIPDLVKVVPNIFQSGRATVTAVNGSQSDNVTVDLSSVTGLSAGDNVTVANVQDLLVDIATLTLDANKRISIDMRAVSHTVATPVGWAAPATTFPLFGAFVVRKA